MASQWHYKKGGEQHGPYSSAELKELSRTGRLLRTDLVWKEGMVNWVPASKLAGLFAEPPADTPISSAIRSGTPTAPTSTPKAEAGPPPVPRQMSSENWTEGAASASVIPAPSFPSRIKAPGEGKSLAPRWIAFGGIAALLLIGASVLAFRLVSTPARHPKVAAVSSKTFREELLGEWKGTDGNRKFTAKFLKDQVVLSGPDGEDSQMFPYELDDARRVATMDVPEKGKATARLEDDGRLYLKAEQNNKVVVLAREYKGGWHSKGEVDSGDRTEGPGLSTGDVGGVPHQAGDVNRLKLGMSPSEVKAIMGEPDDEMTSPLLQYQGQVVLFRYGTNLTTATKVFFAKDGRPLGKVTLVMAGDKILLNGTGE